MPPVRGARRYGFDVCQAAYGRGLANPTAITGWHNHSQCAMLLIPILPMCGPASGISRRALTGGCPAM